MKLNLNECYDVSTTYGAQYRRGGATSGFVDQPRSGVSKRKSVQLLQIAEHKHRRLYRSDWFDSVRPAHSSYGPEAAPLSQSWVVCEIISDTPFSGTHTYSDEQQQLPMRAKGFRLHRLQSYTRGDTDSRNLFRKFLDCWGITRACSTT